MGKSIVGDVNYFSTVLKMSFNAGIARFLGHRAKPLTFFTVHVSAKDKYFFSPPDLILYVNLIAMGTT